ncbi:hypothetical protein ACYX7E_09725 [Luteimonas sp. RIT-PG2_3]
MSMTESDVEHQAVSRLFDLVRNGDTETLEFDQLDSLIYGRLQQTYRVTDADQADAGRVLAVD